MTDYLFSAPDYPPKNGATQEWVFQLLREAIVSGKLAGGTQLKQDEISESLQVSHIPLREALRRLEAQGLVQIQKNKGAVVTKLSRETLEDMMEIRASISYYLLRRAVPLMTEEDFETLQTIVDRERKETDMMEVELLNYRFHDVLTKRADNWVAEHIIEILHANMDRYLREGFYGEQKPRSVSLQEHQAILDACKRRDAQKAASLLHDHILSAPVTVRC